MLRFPLNMLPNVITSLIEAWVSTQRIQKYLLSPELDPAAVQHSLDNKISTAISIEDGRFSWDANADFTVLKDVNFNVRLRSPTLSPPNTTSLSKTSLNTHRYPVEVSLLLWVEWVAAKRYVFV